MKIKLAILCLVVFLNISHAYAGCYDLPWPLGTSTEPSYITHNPDPDSLPYPNLHVEEFNVHDTPDHKLPDDGTGYLNPGQTYELHIWPES